VHFAHSVFFDAVFSKQRSSFARQDIPMFLVYPRWMSLGSRLSAGLILGAFGLSVAASGCAADAGDPASDNPADQVDDTSADQQDLTLESADFKTIARPAGLPKVWNQPDSRGWFGEKGMCGPTSVANALNLYGIVKSPTVIYNEGVHSLIGTLPGAMISYLDKNYAQLKCDYQRAAQPEAFLLGQLRAKRPVNILIAMAGLQAHWVTVVGARKVAGEPNYRFIVMTWGSYREVKGEILLRHWNLATDNPYVSFGVPSRYTLPVRD
jgi:hypothetical protein